MKFKIGDRVKWEFNKYVNDRYLILATREQDLNINFLKSLEGKIKIHKIKKLAEIEIKVKKDYDYKICKEDELFKNNCSVLIGNIQNVNENNLSY